MGKQYYSIFQYYRPHAWQVYLFFSALSISGFSQSAGYKGGLLGHVTLIAAKGRLYP